MKRAALFLMIILALPMVLAACGGGATGNAKDFLNAWADGDTDKMKDVSCDEFSSTIDLLAEGSEEAELEDVKCEEDGDNRVTCTARAEGEDEEEITFIMDDDKVCGIEGLTDLDSEDIPDVEIPTVAPTPDTSTENTNDNTSTENTNDNTTENTNDNTGGENTNENAG